jgi:hypothetical protein
MNLRSTYTLADANEDATSTGTAPAIIKPFSAVSGSFVCVISVTANLTLQGRATPTGPWVTLVAEITASAVAAIPFILPEMRVIWDTNAGAISYWITA